MKIKAKDYKNREDLEAFIRDEVGLTVDLKPDYSIEGKKDELKILHLSDRNTVWGINVINVTDEPTKNKKVHKVKRGKIFKSKIN